MPPFTGGQRVDCSSCFNLDVRGSIEIQAGLLKMLILAFFLDIILVSSGFHSTIWLFSPRTLQLNFSSPWHVSILYIWLAHYRAHAIQRNNPLFYIVGNTLYEYLGHSKYYPWSCSHRRAFWNWMNWDFWLIVSLHFNSSYCNSINLIPVCCIKGQLGLLCSLPAIVATAEYLKE